MEDGGSEVVGQLALADFIARGELDRHLRRMRGVVRGTTVGAAGRPVAPPPGRARGRRPAGLHELVWLPPGSDERALGDAAAERGVGVEGLSLHRYAGDGPPALVLGYGGLDEAALDRAVALLAAA